MHTDIIFSESKLVSGQKKLTADAVHGESQDGIRLFLCYNKRLRNTTGEWQFMNQVIQTVLAAFSNQNIEINTARKLANLKKFRSASSLGGERRYCDKKSECGKIPLRLYFSSEETKMAEMKRSPPRFFSSMEEDGLQRV